LDGLQYGLLSFGNTKGKQAEACPAQTAVKILRKKLCGFCAIPGRAVDDIPGAMPVYAFECRLSSQSSTGRLAHAQGKRIPVRVDVPFPHFHSDYYYYDLYTYIKKGYSSHSQQ
jgi:hypothetical protein